MHTQTLSVLTLLAAQFLTDRNWWQFHNPKNDVLNIIVEASELADHFITRNGTPASRIEIANELADVLFATLVFAHATKHDIANALSTLLGTTSLSDTSTDLDQLSNLALQDTTALPLSTLHSPEQLTLSLITQVGKLADLFIWCTAEQSFEVATRHREYIARRLAHIMAHIMGIASYFDFDLAAELTRKMALTAQKYPVDRATGADYVAIKDAHRQE